MVLILPVAGDATAITITALPILMQDYTLTSVKTTVTPDTMTTINSIN